MKPETDQHTAIGDRRIDLCDWGGHDLRRGQAATLVRRNTATRKDVQAHATIRVANQYDASPMRAFDAWLDPEIAGRWLFATASLPMTEVDIDGRVGGSFCLVRRQAREIARYNGHYVEIVPGRSLVFTIAMEPHPDVITRVSVAFASVAKGCTLRLTHDNIPRAHATYVEGRWTGILYGLGVTLDSESAMSNHDQE